MTSISIHRAGPAWPPDASTFYGQHHGWLLGWLRKSSAVVIMLPTWRKTRSCAY